MKTVLVICAPALEGLVMEALAGNGGSRYTKFPYLLGEGGHSEPHLDNHVWPGSNVGIFVATEDENIKKIVEAIKKIKSEHQKDGVKAFVIPIEEIV
jgi:nitrogen regulatory protein PII